MSSDIFSYPYTLFDYLFDYLLGITYMATPRMDGYIGELSDQCKARHKEKTKKKSKRFVKGPIPLPWLLTAAALSPSACVVALIVWHARGLYRRDNDLRICPSDFERFGLTSRTGSRCLYRLEEAGLISVDRQRGRCARVAILMPCEAKEDPTHEA